MLKRKFLYILIMANIFFALINYTSFNTKSFAENILSNKKVIHIDSYNRDYPRTVDIADTIQNYLKESNIQSKTFYMDTKNFKDEKSKTASALKAKQTIEEYKPDLIIATDDNAAKYLIQPYYKDSNIPIVFTGLNWDASQYSFPTKNMTGMIEINAVDELLKVVSAFTESKTIAFLTTDTITGRKEAKYTKELFGIDFIAEEYVNTFDEWKEKYLNLQEKADILYLYNTYGMEGFDKKQTIEFVNNNTRILTCSTSDFMKEFAAIVYAKVAIEQGRYAAETALKILSGIAPKEIAVTKNKEGKIYINPKLINKLELTVPEEIIEISSFVY